MYSIASRSFSYVGVKSRSVARNRYMYSLDTSRHGSYVMYLRVHQGYTANARLRHPRIDRRRCNMIIPRREAIDRSQAFLGSAFEFLRYHIFNKRSR